MAMGAVMMRRIEPDDASHAPLPLRYSTNLLVLMARDPNSAHAYWDIDLARISNCLAILDGGKALLRLFDAATGESLAEHETSAEHGRYDLALPRAARAYVADLALVNHGRAEVLARSNIIYAPPDAPKWPAEAVFVERADQSRALAVGGMLSSGPPAWPRLLPRQPTWLSEYGAVMPGLGTRVPRPGTASEARLIGIGLARRGSEDRLQA